MKMNIHFNKERFLELVARLRMIFSLNEYESKVLAYLSMEPRSDVKNLFYYSGVPRARIYDIAESLERKGLLRLLGKEDGEKKMFLEFVGFDKAIDNIKAKMLAEMNSRMKFIEDSIPEIDEMVGERAKQ